MLDPAEHFRFFGPFDMNEMLFNHGIYPPLNKYPGNLPGSTRVKYFRSRGGRRYNHARLNHNFDSTEIVLNNMTDANFAEHSNLASSKFIGSNGTGLVTQDEITTMPIPDMTNVTRNRIPRFDENGNLPMPNSDKLETTNGRLVSANSTVWIKVKKDVGQFEFAVGSAAEAWLDQNGWTSSLPADTSAPTFGFAIVFDDTRSLWLFFKDNDVIGVVDGNVQTSNFKNAQPGDDVVFPTTQAFIDLDQTNSRIEFWCQTENDTAVRGVGFIDSAGTNDGEA